MENRSFDMMLGHLSLDGMPDVDGLTGPDVNSTPTRTASRSL
jgi:hypothetical protein